MFDLSRFCFPGFIFAHRRKFYSLWIHFSSAFTQCVLLLFGRQWIKAIIDFTPTLGFSFGWTSSKLANTTILHAQFGQRHTWISIFLRVGLLLCIYVLVQLNFHAFLVVFSVTLTHTHKHGYHWKLALQQLLLIFATIRLCVDRLWNTTSTVSSKAKATIQF